MRSSHGKPPLVALLLLLSPLFATADTASAADAEPSTSQQPRELGPAEKMQLLQAEIVSGLESRNLMGRFQQFQRYARQKLDTTVADRTGSELTGLCRLSWYDHLFRNLLAAPIEAEAFTRQLHEDMSGDHRGLAAALATAREKLDVAERTAEPRFKKVNSPEAALVEVERALVRAQSAYARALSPLTEAEVKQLDAQLYRIFGSEPQNGHTIPNRTQGRVLCQLLRKMDRSGVLDAADAVLPLTDLRLLDQLARLSDTPQSGASHPAVTGQILRRITTPAGDILVGGRGPNTYRLDEMASVAAIVDLGGDDIYIDGVTAPDRRVLIIIDLDGNDRYEGTKAGIQGGSVLGVSVLIDRRGNDTYSARDVAQGATIGGVGILIDFEGNDTYRAVKRAQGSALGGVGILHDRAGHDRYRAALWAQGLGHPLGFGLLSDLDGDDEYFVGGLLFDSYPETPGYDGWGQGIGAGIRQVANGGFGIILDGGGDDIYEFDYMSHGGGYWMGVGFARDFGGNDQRLGATRERFDGQRRTERLFQRFSNGFGCHYALGFLFDDEGDDLYHGTIMGLGMAWDLALGYLCDFGGNDRYTATGGLTQGNGAEAGIGVLFDYSGDDVYLGYGQGRASSTITYHDPRQCGGNFSFVVDYGGNDQYGSGARNNTYNVRTSPGGFLIDRPSAAEASSP